jgi:ligand-binding sensor domain-containing protein
MLGSRRLFSRNSYICLVFALRCPPNVALDPSQPLGQLYHTSWNAKDGFNGSITALAQTQNGFLWIGTSDGLIRFDGLSFEPCKPEVGSLISTAGPIEVRVRAADCHTSRLVF